MDMRVGCSLSAWTRLSHLPHTVGVTPHSRYVPLPSSPQVIIATGVTFAFSLDSVYNIEIVGHIPAG